MRWNKSEMWDEEMKMYEAKNVESGGGEESKKLLRMSLNTFWFWNFWNPMKLEKCCQW